MTKPHRHTWNDEGLTAYLKQLIKEQAEQKDIANEIQHMFLKRRFKLLFDHGKI